jgi:uncharacterized membrane protein (DUF373 family)
VSDGDTAPDDGEEASDDGQQSDRSHGRVATVTNRFIHAVELVAAAVFASLFAIGVFDLMLQIVDAVRTGRITDPLVVIGFIDTGLLLLIIVEVYQTVIAYTEESETRRLVRLVIYTGVIAMVRKIIIFRTGEYGSIQGALLAAAAYTILIFGLVALLIAERRYGNRLMS